MFKLLNRYKKGVSPVIAVVLLIALTVAAAAVIWAVTNNLIGGGTASLAVRDASGERGAGGRADNDLTVTGVFVASEELTVVDISLVDDESETETYDTLTVGSTSGTTTIPGSENQFTISFVEDNGSFSGGSYEITVTFTSADGGSQQIYQFNVNAP